jgi:antitoxin ParD1/3/4
MTKPYVFTPSEEGLVERLVASGRYASAEEVVREALQLLREAEESEHLPIRDLESFRRAWREGFESGDPAPAEEVFDRLEAKYEAMARDRGL